MRHNFTERMDTARELAQVARNRGLHTGKRAAGWSNKSRANTYRGFTELDQLELWFKQWRHEWRYAALAAVDWALFGEDYQDIDGAGDLRAWQSRAGK